MDKTGLVAATMRRNFDTKRLFLIGWKSSFGKKHRAGVCTARKSVEQ